MAAAAAWGEEQEKASWVGEGARGTSQESCKHVAPTSHQAQRSAEVYTLSSPCGRHHGCRRQAVWAIPLLLTTHLSPRT